MNIVNLYHVDLQNEAIQSEEFLPELIVMPTCDMVIAAIKAGAYGLVATFDDASCSSVYEKTQNLESSWAEPFGKSLRSTMVGDLMLVDGNVFVVDTIGFTKVDGVDLDVLGSAI